MARLRRDPVSADVGLADVATTRFLGVEADDRTGRSMVVGGYLTGTGKVDFVIGADRVSLGGTRGGAVYLTTMSVTGDVDLAEAITIYGGEWEQLGRSVAAPGDVDGDGYGTDEGAIDGCDPGAGYTAEGGDCDDTRSDIHPYATEACDSIDNNCDGEVDGPDSAGTSIWYVDVDDDGYGEEGSAFVSCDPGPGHSLTGLDCDDGAIEINPEAVEVCDGVDNDCDGSADGPDAADIRDWYLDGDLDGYGAGGIILSGCNPGMGYADSSDDCDDDADHTYPGADELCDALDNDCNGSLDDGLSLVTHYMDLDEDGHGEPEHDDLLFVYAVCVIVSEQPRFFTRLNYERCLVHELRVDFFRQHFAAVAEGIPVLVTIWRESELGHIGGLARCELSLPRKPRPKTVVANSLGP